jgi:hypothetical protein
MVEGKTEECDKKGEKEKEKEKKRKKTKRSNQVKKKQTTCTNEKKTLPSLELRVPLISTGGWCTVFFSQTEPGWNAGHRRIDGSSRLSQSTYYNKPTESNVDQSLDLSKFKRFPHIS